MEDSQSNIINFSFQSFQKENNKEDSNMNLRSIQSFISQNNSNNLIENSNNLEDIIFKELEKNKRSYLNNGIYFKRKVEGSNPNTRRGKNNSLFNSNQNSINNENNNISRSDQLLDLYKNSLLKSFNQSKILQYSPNKNYIPDSDSDEEKEKEKKKEKKKEEEEKNYEENENDSIREQSKNSDNNNISLRISIPNILINSNSNYNRESNFKSKIFNSQNELISSLKKGNLLLLNRFSLKNNFPKLNNNLSSRNTISYMDKKNYQLLVYSLPNQGIHIPKISIMNSIYSSNPNENPARVKSAKIIQKWWRELKPIMDEKLNKIIKIQSVWRGICSRKYTCEIIYLCISCQNFYDILSKIIINHVRKLVWNLLLFKFNKEYYIIKKTRLLFNRYQYLKPNFEKWKCINKLILFKLNLNKENIITKKKINLKKFDEMLQYDDEERLHYDDEGYYNNKNKKQMDIIDEYDLKVLYINSIFMKMRLNKIRYTFDCINHYNKKNTIIFKKYSKTKENGNNNSLKRYFLYKWRNITKKLEINNLREKLLNYLIIKFSKKSLNNILFKYFSRWKLLTEDEKIKANLKRKVIREKKAKKSKKKKLEELINLSLKIKRLNSIIFIRALIRKWRFLMFAKKIARQKMLKMYEIVQKTYGKISEDIYDLDEKKIEKYKAINNNNQEDENNFIEQINKIYNEKKNNNFKFKYKLNNKK